VPAVERASDLLGLKVYDAEGKYLGRIADLVTEGDDDPVIVAAIVTRPPWGRLLGYERESATGPKLLELLARSVMRRDSQRIDWNDLRLSP
jgi:sporulation protein YlmC with PRC-barrel domain